jgi:type IX secretion system PorP/SprF family membrane protein
MSTKDRKRIRRTSLLFAIALLMLASGASAQLDPLYAQYFNTPVLINPAFTGIHNRWVSSVGYRAQWTGLEGAAKTLNFNSHISLLDNKVGVGIVVVDDRIGENQNKEFNALLSYRIQLNEGTVSFGMQVGAMQFTNNGGGLQLRDPNDPKFAPFNEFKFNSGAGLLYKTDKMLIAASVPRLLNNDISVGPSTIQVYDRHYYLMGSYTFYLNQRVNFVPTALLKATKNNPVSADVNANVSIDDAYTAGIFTRNFNSFGLMCTVRLTNYRLGYVFEVPGSNPGTSFTTHEVTLAFGMAVFNYHERIFQRF